MAAQQTPFPAPMLHEWELGMLSFCGMVERRLHILPYGLAKDQQAGCFRRRNL